MLIALDVIFLGFFIFILVVGLKNFFSLESFYKKMTLARVPPQIFLLTINTLIFVLLLGTLQYWTSVDGGIARLEQKKVKPQEVNPVREFRSLTVRSNGGFL